MKTAGSPEHAHLRPATCPLDGPMRCQSCQWQGLRSSAIRAAVLHAGTPEETYVAYCPQCEEFRLRPVVSNA
jgi:hypothetical protein